MIYDSFAGLYDDLFDPEQYQNWHQYTKNRLGDGVKTILDLAGGSGRLSVMLAEDGYSVCDLDFAPAMLSLADEHAREAGVDVSLVQSDMRDLSGVGQFDAVVSYADSLCYLESFSDVQETLTQVFQHLKTGGHFLFDVWSTYQTDHVFPGYCYNYESDDQRRAFMWRSYGDDDVDHGVIHELTFFSQVDDGHYKRQHETHFERTYPLEQWRQALQKVGFKKLAVSANFGQSNLTPTTTRWFFDCQKG